VGYPAFVVDRIGHPVIWIGGLIEILEKRLNDPKKGFAQRRRNGVLALGAVLMAVLIVALGIQTLLRAVPLGWVIEVMLASSLIAQKGLRDAVLWVADALRGEGIEAGRQAVSHIVGRDVSALDEAGVSRAAIETLAENASDGVIAPLVFLVLFGLPGAALYKAINTADSMIGHRSKRYEAFGWAAAKLDDLVNLVPARLTAGLFVIAARMVPGGDAGAGWTAAKRDAPHHASPNAGWPEAAMAGALGFGLGGPRSYGGDRVNLPRMGDGRRLLDADDIMAAIGLYDRAMLMAMAALGVWALMQMAVV